MQRSLKNSNRHFKNAVKQLPLGVSSNFRYWGEDKTIYVDHGKGGRITDIDGNEYVDYRMGYGPGILGYTDARVDEAAREGMDVGGVFALSTQLEYEVAKRISSMVPAAELVRYSNSGTEAVMAALRIAKAYTIEPMMGNCCSITADIEYVQDWLDSDYSFYDAMASELHELGVLCEPDSREPWFICEAHAKDDSLSRTLTAFEQAVDITITKQNTKQTTPDKRSQK